MTATFNIDLAVTVANQAIVQAGDILLSRLGNSRTTARKELRDIVTAADIDAERVIVDRITAAFPTHTIVTEENRSIDRGSEYEWIIDPLDGTVNFVSGLPLFNVSVALWHNKGTLLGLVYVPYLRELFHAVKGRGAFLNNDPIRTSSTKSIDEAVISGILTGHYADALIDQTVSFIGRLSKRARGVRVIISEALELSYVAAGRLDGNFVHKADIYGAAAGKLLVEEAGGVFTELDGTPFTMESKTILASCSAELHDQLIGIAKSS